ncbi:MAG: P-II family nitrogen regulator [Candidatus Bathyarchaeia archaeon]
MKKIEAVIKPDMFSYVKAALSKAGYPSLTAYDVKGRGTQSGVIETVNGKTIHADILPKTKIEIVVDDRDVKEVIEVIMKTARTGTIGDGKIFVSTVDEVIRIRTGERDSAAI